MSPIGEEPAVAAGLLWKIGNLVHFHDKCQKIHQKSIRIHQQLMLKQLFWSFYAHSRHFRQENDVVEMTATTGSGCGADGSNYFEGSMNLQMFYRLQKPSEND